MLRLAILSRVSTCPVNTPECVVCHATGQMLIPASRAASLHSASSTDIMLAEGYLDLQSSDVEGGGGIQPLITPSGIGINERCGKMLCNRMFLQCILYLFTCSGAACVWHLADWP